MISLFLIFFLMYVLCAKTAMSPVKRLFFVVTFKNLHQCLTSQRSYTGFRSAF